MSGLKNMSGLWSGEYRYNANGECVSFTAMLTEIDAGTGDVRPTAGL